MTIVFKQKLHHAVTQTANTIVKNHWLIHGLHQRRSLRTNGPGSGNPLRICSSVKLSVGLRSYGRGSHGRAGSTTPSVRIRTCASETKGIFIVHSQTLASR